MYGALLNDIAVKRLNGQNCNELRGKDGWTDRILVKAERYPPQANQRAREVFSKAFKETNNKSLQFTVPKVKADRFGKYTQELLVF